MSMQGINAFEILIYFTKVNIKKIAFIIYCEIKRFQYAFYYYLF